MSGSPEGHFEPYPPDALPSPDIFVRELERFGEYPLVALWEEQDRVQDTLFQDIHAQTQLIQKHGTEAAGTWQTFYSGVRDEAEMRTWIVGRPNFGLVHLLVTHEAREMTSRAQKLRYMEYAFSTERHLVGERRGVVYKHPAAAWTEGNLQHCAAMITHDGHVNLRRGAINAAPVLADPNLSRQEPAARLKLSQEIQDRLINIRSVLGVFVLGTAYHEPGVTGLFYDKH